MKERIFISIFEMIDIGGVGVSAYNFISTLSEKYDIDLCVLTNQISSKFVFPANVRIIKNTHLFEMIYGDRLRITGSNFQKLYSCLLRIVRKFYGYENTFTLAINPKLIQTNYKIAIAFWNDSFNKKGKMVWGGDCYNVLHNISAEFKIAWIHNDANQFGLTHEICNNVYKKFDAIVNVSKDGKKTFDSIIPEYKYKSFVVYNCYNIEEIKHKSILFNPYNMEDKRLKFVTVCRMNERQKKISRILYSCKRLRDGGYNNFTWTIVGNGDDLEGYKKQVAIDGTMDIINFAGLQPNPFPYMKFSDAMIMSSLFEGLPMTIKESQILGTPTFSTRFGSAEEAIIIDRQGDVCENSAEGLYRMVKRILDEPSVIEVYKDYLSKYPITNDIAVRQFMEMVDALSEQKTKVTQFNK